jgi:hypothetical protein
VNRQPLSVDADVSVKKDLCQPSAGQDVVGDGRYDEPAFARCQGRKGDDLVCGKPIQRCTGREIVEQLLGDVLPNRLRTSSQGPRLVRTEAHRFSFIGEERERSPSLQRLCIVANLDLDLMSGFGEDVSRGIRHPLTHPPFFQMGGERNPPHPCHWAWFLSGDSSEGLTEGCYSEAEYAIATGHVARPPDLNFRTESHVLEHWEKYLSKMENRRGEILKEAPSQFDCDPRCCEGKDGHKAKTQHGRRTGRADVPMIVAPCLEKAGAEREFLRTLRQPLSVAVDELGNGFHDANVLRAQPGLVSLRSSIDQVDGPASQGGEGDRLSDDRTTSGIAGTVNRQHEAIVR